MKHFILAAVVVTGLCQSALGQSPVTLTVDTKSPGRAYPADVIGFSFETGSLRFNHYRTNEYFFDSNNKPLLTLFRNLGVRTLRIGGNSVDSGYVPSHDEIDALFRFVKAADLKVVYSLRLANGDPQQDAAAAKYVWDTYRPYLISLAIGNEPNSYSGLDHEISNSPSFLAKWSKFASAVEAAVPDVKLGGVDNGNGATTWASDFAEAEKGDQHVVSILAHLEPGGRSRDKTPPQMIDEMLSPTCDAVWNAASYKKLGEMAHAHGLYYMFSEANSHVATPASKGVNHSFATALFALDFMHWWAAHDCRAVCFHTGLTGFNAALYAHDGNYELYPIGYGVAAFNLGGHGTAESVAITNPDKLNLSTYAVADTNGNLFVTVINKEHGTGARDARVRVNADGKPGGIIYLTSPNNDIMATNGITLGGASVDGGENWQGKWTLPGSEDNNALEVVVKASSAAIVKLTGGGTISPSPYRP